MHTCVYMHSDASVVVVGDVVMLHCIVPYACATLILVHGSLSGTANTIGPPYEYFVLFTSIVGRLNC